MNLSKRLHLMLVLSVVFIGSFIVAYGVISLTPNGYYTQRVYTIPQNTSQVDNVTGIAVASTWVGPASNATNVPLDIAIIIDQARGASLENLVMAPETKIAYNITERGSFASSRITLIPTELLQPATKYTVSAEVQNQLISWTFTTSSEPFELKCITYMSPYVPCVALVTAAGTTLVVSIVILFPKKPNSN